MARDKRAAALLRHGSCLRHLGLLHDAVPAPPPPPTMTPITLPLSRDFRVLYIHTQRGTRADTREHTHVHTRTVFLTHVNTPARAPNHTLPRPQTDTDTDADDITRTMTHALHPPANTHPLPFSLARALSLHLATPPPPCPPHTRTYRG